MAVFVVAGGLGMGLTVALLLGCPGPVAWPGSAGRGCGPSGL